MTNQDLGRVSVVENEVWLCGNKQQLSSGIRGLSARKFWLTYKTIHFACKAP